VFIREIRGFNCILSARIVLVLLLVLRSLGLVIRKPDVAGPSLADVPDRTQRGTATSIFAKGYDPTRGPALPNAAPRRENDYENEERERF
jgi:hypothetical protein